MAESSKLAKAELRQLDADFKNEIKKEKKCTVQFNPDSLKVSFANQIATPSGAGDQKGTPARQFVGAGTTKLSLTLWFDVSAEMPAGVNREADVRKLTAKVAYFITPEKEGDKFVPPAVRFAWGSFQFDGIMESMEETLEYFSPDGIPLRASVAINLTQQKITEFSFAKDAGKPPPGAGPSRGARPLTPAPAGKSLQGLADGAGKGDDWQGIAAANGIENPRMLQPGQLIDMGASVSAGASFSGGAPFGAGASLQAGASFQTQASAPLQTGAQVSADSTQLTADVL